MKNIFSTIISDLKIKKKSNKKAMKYISLIYDNIWDIRRSKFSLWPFWHFQQSSVFRDFLHKLISTYFKSLQQSFFVEYVLQNHTYVNTKSHSINLGDMLFLHFGVYRFDEDRYFYNVGFMRRIRYSDIRPSPWIRLTSWL